MLKKLTTALMVLAAPAGAADLVGYHGWSTTSEISALKVLIDEFESRGNTWTDLAIPHESEANVGLINLITGGNPPNIFVESNPGVYRDLAKMGMGQPVTELFNETGVTPNLPDVVLRSITVDDEIMKIPTGIHIDGMIYYNKEVAEEAGVDPESWTSLDDMFADFDKVREAGFLPIVSGGQSFQAGYLTHALVAAIGGPDIYYRMYGEEPDPTVFDEPEIARVIETVRKIQQEADEGSMNRSWSETTNLVITGKALMHLHGDWMKGEWRAAGKVAGEDFGCINIPGTKALSVTVDAFGILGGVDDETKAAELEWASIVVDPEITAKFSANKGSSPVRFDAPKEALDVCNEVVLNALQDPEMGVQNPFNITDGDWHMSIWEVMFNFWSDPDMTTEEAIDGLKDAYDAVFG
jgi:glucose/mannose transport system substrate-binding protein